MHYTTIVNDELCLSRVNMTYRLVKICDNENKEKQQEKLKKLSYNLNNFDIGFSYEIYLKNIYKSIKPLKNCTNWRL